MLGEGTPADEILDYAEGHAIDVMGGGKDQATVERFFIRNTAAKTLRHAPISVVVVPHHTDPS